LVAIKQKCTVRNNNVRKKTGLWKLEVIITERRLRRLERVRIAHQATQWQLISYMPGHPRKNWVDVVK